MNVAEANVIDVFQDAQTSRIGVESLRLVAVAPNRASHAVHMLLLFSEFSRLVSYMLSIVSSSSEGRSGAHSFQACE